MIVSSNEGIPFEVAKIKNDMSNPSNFQSQAYRRPPRTSPEPDTYDFSRREKFSHDQIRFLERVFGKFVEGITTKLAPMLQVRFQARLLEIRTLDYGEYLSVLPDPNPVLVFEAEKGVRGFIDIDFDLAFAIFDRLMGGKGVPPREELRPYFTELEETILDNCFQSMLSAYGEAWSEVKEVTPVKEKIEFNPNSVYICNPSDKIVTASCQLDVAHAQGLINICLPFHYLYNAIPKRSFDEFMLTTTFQSTKDDGLVFPESIHNARVPLSVSLGSTQLLFQELLSVEVGDTIRLSTEVTEPLRVKVNGKTKFLGQPGVREGRLAVRVNKVLNEGDEEYDE